MKYAICQVLAMAVFCAASTAGRQQQDASRDSAAVSKEEVLAGWAAALGGRENLRAVRAVHLRGSIETGGLNGIYDRWTTSRGEFRTAVDLSGAFRQTSVFDGQKGWLLDTNGTVHELSGDTFKSVVSASYEASYSFLFSGRVPGHVDFVSEVADQAEYIFRLEPEKGSTVTVYLNKKTFLPSREETGGPMGKRVIHFSDWRDFGGIKFPCAVRQSAGDARFDAVITIEKVEINLPIVAQLFERPGNVAEQIRFAFGTRQAVVPAEVYGDHIFVPVRVNGRSPAWFFLDSGAGMSVVSNSLAQRAGLSLGGTVRGQGTGAGSARIGMAKKVTLDLPGAQVPPTTVAVWDFSPIQPALGRHWDGLLGYDVISRLVVRVDYEHKQVTLYDPSTFVADDRATALAVTFLGNLPLVRAKIVLPGRAPVETECAIDSGADGFHLTTPFANANHVLESVGRTISTSSVGAGGGTKEFAGRIAGLQLGPYMLGDPVAAFSTTEGEGLLASPEIGALIGGRILKRFTVTFDYPHHRILLEPNSRFSDPFRTNESGLSLVANGADFHRFEVDDVEKGSPAEFAGVKKGDVLTVINGRPANELDLEKIDEILQQAGSTIPLTLKRDARTLRLALRLKERI